MIYIKKFENMFSEPQINDYIVCNRDIFVSSIMSSLHLEPGFFINNIGKIYHVNKDNYYVEYENNKNYIVNIDEIAYFSNDKYKVEAYNDQNKYNL